MSDWNGMLIKDMTTRHLENTMRYLENQAKKKYKYGGDWRSYVDTRYFDMELELSKRNADHNFGAPR